MDIGEMQRRLSVKASKEPGHKFGDLLNLICRTDWLLQAHDHVASNAGSKTAGCDGITMGDFDQDLDHQIQVLREQLKGGEFQPHPVRRVHIPKGDGKVRPLGIPSIRDRIVQEALRMALEPIFEADFCQESYGFRPDRRTMDAIAHLKVYTMETMKYFWVIEGDIKSYFDTINHRRLMKLLGRRIEDRKALRLIRDFLRAGVMERKQLKDTPTGAPQGGIISPLLANVYLHELDKFMLRHAGLAREEKTIRRKEGLGNFAYARYADDFVVLCSGKEDEALEMRDELHEFLATRLRLKLSLEKTKVTHLNRGFIFLGFEMKRGRSGKTGRKVTRILIPEEKAKKHLDALKSIFSSDTDDSATTKFQAANRVIAGWCRYYQHTSKPSARFSRLGYETFWLAAHWLARKYRCSMPQVMRRFRRNGSLGTADVRLTLHTDFKRIGYRTRPRPFPNPYIEGKVIREVLPDETPWIGNETRKGSADTRIRIIKRDNFTCQWEGCGRKVTLETAEVDHMRPRSAFGWKWLADRDENLWTLCPEHHKIKTENDRERESRVH
jgi:group II intron reverse transcriptase/maturase